MITYINDQVVLNYPEKIKKILKTFPRKERYELKKIIRTIKNPDILLAAIELDPAYNISVDIIKAELEKFIGIFKTEEEFAEWFYCKFHGINFEKLIPDIKMTHYDILSFSTSYIDWEYIAKELSYNEFTYITIDNTVFVFDNRRDRYYPIQVFYFE